MAKRSYSSGSIRQNSANSFLVRYRDAIDQMERGSNESMEPEENL